MRYKLTFLFILLTLTSYPQTNLEEQLIQNFYTACVPNKYQAFLYLNTGIQLFETNQFNRSINKFRKTLELDSLCCDAWYLIAFSYQSIGNYNDALVACDRSIEINRYNPSAWVIKGNTLLFLKDTVNAFSAFEKAKEYSSEKIDGYYGMALILFWKHNYDDALKIIIEFDDKKDKSNSRRDLKKMQSLKLNILSKK